MRALHLILLIGMLCGCSTRVIPPTVHSEPTSVYLSDYGRHSSLLLPVRGGFNEYAFGDWSFFARGHTGWWIGAKALIHSPQATLGRRFVPAASGALGAEDVGAVRLMHFSASMPRVRH